MIEPLKIFRKSAFRGGASSWWITDELGTHPVTVQLKGNGWQLLTDPDDVPDLLIETFNKKYKVVLEDDAQRIMWIDHYVEPGAPGRNASSVLIHPHSPIASFFQKTGVNSAGETLTVCINHTLDKQKY